MVAGCCCVGRVPMVRHDATRDRFSRKSVALEYVPWFVMSGVFATDTRIGQVVNADEAMALQGLHTNADFWHQRRESRLRQWQPRFQYGWALHFIVTLSLMLCAIYANGGTQ